MKSAVSRPGSSQDCPPPDRRSVSGSVYDRGREKALPPLGVEDVSIEPMDPTGVELLARDLLELLEWAKSIEERRDE